MKITLAAVVAMMLVHGCGTADPKSVSSRYVVDIYNPDKVYGGTTIFGDTSDPTNPRLVEVDLAGKVIWTYVLPDSLLSRGRARGGMDVEWLPKSNNILICIRDSGIHEISRAGKIVWSKWHNAVSHDVDRLPNGNTLAVWGWGEDSSSPEAFEVDPAGKIVWQWNAEPHLKGFKRHFDREGYTHANSVVRLKNGNTLISLRNFYMLVEVNRAGDIVWKLENLFTTPHDPEELANGNILLNTRRPQVLREYDRSGRVVWEHYPRDANTIRYNHKLPNGNIMFVERRKIVEITPNGEIVWQMRLKDVGTDRSEKSRWFYKAERIPSRRGDTLPLPPASSNIRAKPDARGPIKRSRTVSTRMLERFDKDGDGRLTKREYRGRRIPFETLDLNGDEFATPEEIEKAISNRRSR